MWGKLSTTTIGGVRVGVIPTCVGQIETTMDTCQMFRAIPTEVGQTPSGVAANVISGSHPHECGANSPRAVGLLCGYGAIPTHVGQRRNPAINYTGVRAIPTHVGKRWNEF